MNSSIFKVVWTRVNDHISLYHILTNYPVFKAYNKMIILKSTVGQLVSKVNW